jgi:hypothetical protein
VLTCILLLAASLFACLTGIGIVCFEAMHWERDPIWGWWGTFAHTGWSKGDGMAVFLCWATPGRCLAPACVSGLQASSSSVCMLARVVLLRHVCCCLWCTLNPCALLARAVFSQAVNLLHG